MFEFENSKFNEIIDEVILNSESDAELKHAIAWIDNQAKNNGISFYQEAITIIRRYIADKRAREWMHGRS